MAKTPNLIPNTPKRSSLMSRLLEASGNVHADTLQDSEIINNGDCFSTAVKGINIALSGELNGGMSPGLLQIVGESKSFKTLFMLVIAKAYLDKYPEAEFLLFDSEFGASKKYFESVGIDPNRVGHLPIKSVEDLRTQANKIMDKMTRGDKVFFGVDSLGLLPSSKEVKDAISGNEAADLTRARAMNSFFRTVVVQLVPLDVPMVVVNHSYDSIGGFIPTKTVKGGKNSYLASNDIWMITRANDRETSGEKELIGYRFTIGIEKSRTVKEKSKIPIMVSMEQGIDTYSGLLDIAEEGGFITRPTKQKYEYKGEIVGSEKETNKFLDKLILDPAFDDFIKKTYKQAGKSLIQKKE